MSDWRAELRARLEGMELAAAREAEIIDELTQHLTERELALLQSGVPRDEARRQVLDEIDDHVRLRRDLEHSAVRPLDPAPGSGGVSLRHVFHDIRYACRTLVRDRGYFVTAFLALAVGIGGTTAIFGAIDAILLRPMPFPHADRLVVPVSENLARGTERGSTSFADYTDWRAQQDIFAAVAAWWPVNFDITGDGEPERVQAAQVSEDYFRVIDVTPVNGRTLQPADHAPTAPRVTVITHRLWQRRFGGADVIGRTMTIAGVPVQIVGVLPPKAVWPDTGELFLPLRPAALSEDVRTRRDNLIFQNFARLREDVTLEQANTRVRMMATQLEQSHPNIRTGWTNRLVPLREYIVSDDVSRALGVLLAAVGGVLLIACANVANLALVRGQSRARELAIRLSLGASRGRLIQQLITESVVLAALSAVAAAGIAALAIRGLVAMAPDGTPFVDTIALDGRVLAGLLVVAVLAVLISGVTPALVTSALRLGPAMKDGSAGAGVSARAARLRHALVIMEVAGAVVLLVLSSLLLRSFGRLATVDAGVDLDRVLTARISLPGARYPAAENRRNFYDQLVRRLESDPAVERAAAASYVPAGTGGFGLGRVFLADGRPEPPAGTDVPAYWNVVTPGYFDAVGIRLLTGRDFTSTDRAGATNVIIVTDLFAQQMFPNGNAIGQRVRSWRDENLYREIVGIVVDVRYEGLSDRPSASVYVPHAQDSWSSMLLTLRARGGDPLALSPALRSAVASIDSQLAVSQMMTMAQGAADSVAAQRYAALLVGILAGLAVVLAAIGVYSVMSYVFSLRKREMGIRLALGASVANVYGIVFKYGFALTATGLAIGAVVAAIASRWLAALLYETSAADALSWAAMLGAIVLAAVVACLGPARRSAKADPVTVLRAE
jgi:putative ABC transport system permease protein